MTKRPYNLKTWWKSVAATERGGGQEGHGSPL